MATKKPLNGQSNYDMAMQLYGNLDMLVKLAADSNVSDLGTTISLYNYDENSVNKKILFTGYPYSTSFIPEITVCSIPTGFEITSTTPTTIFSHYDNDSGYTFQYSYNTTNTIPLDGEWIDTTHPTIIITSLISGTTYYLFLRKKCDDTFSSIVSTSAKTLHSIPVLPVSTGLVGMYYGSIGVQTNGSGKVTQWNDLSGNGNHLLSVTTPELTVSENEFGVEDAIVFNGLDRLRTASNFVGLDGSDKLTIFIVKKYTGIPVDDCLMMYAVTDDQIINDGFQFRQSSGSGVPYDEFRAKGNVGSNDKTITPSSAGAHIYSIVADKSQTAANEIILKMDKVTSGIGGGSNNTSLNYGSYKLTVGGASNLLSPYQGTVTFIAFFTGALSSIDVDANTDYLMTKFSI